MALSDRIEAFIYELVKNDDGWVELGRNELAGIFNCVPSQINYVMRTRFTPDKGYIVESKRGGGGYIKIRRIGAKCADMIVSIPQELSKAQASAFLRDAVSFGVVDEKTASVIETGVCLDGLEDSALRARMLKNMVEAAVKGEGCERR